MGQRGFCSLMLSRRVVDKTKSYRLDTLRQVFGISSDSAHRAFGDVETVVSLFERVFGPRLEGAGIQSFAALAEFACKTPIAMCLQAVKSKATRRDRSAPAAVVDSWYFIGAQDQTHGPLPAREVLALMGGLPCWVWKAGMTDWESSEQNTEFLHSVQTPPPLAPQPTVTTQRHLSHSMAELLDVCRGIIADGVVTTEEVVFLSKWLEEAGVIENGPQPRSERRWKRSWPTAW